MAWKLWFHRRKKWREEKYAAASKHKIPLIVTIPKPARITTPPPTTQQGLAWISFNKKLRKGH